MAGGAAFTTSIFTGNVKGANDRIALAIIGMGSMGTGNLQYAAKQPGVAITALCDVYRPNLDKALAEAAKLGQQPKGIKDFREILADKSVDAICVTTPDHWHAYMTVEGCKAGKDVWVEKPISTTIDEGRKMVETARKYDRVVQVGTMQRSGDVFQRAVEIVRSGKLGKITFCRTWTYSSWPEKGIGNPPDSDPPPDLDWDLWLGPAPMRPYNPNRFVDGRFRLFWDYAGGTMTDWGVHWLDIVQMAFNEAIPSAVTAIGGKYYLKDNRETPDTLQVIYEYPGFAGVYELRECNRLDRFGQGGGITFHGTQGTLFVDRTVCRLIPEKGADLEAIEERARNHMNLAHWANFLECMRTRKKPVCDIEIGHRSTSTCILGNIALRSRTRLDWDGITVKQAEARSLLARKYRKPWKLEI
jgi:predicted dehydrogenase